MNLSIEDVFHGVTKKIKYNKFEVCDHCNGSGKTDKTKEKVCRTCGGSGFIFSQNSFMSMQQTCPTCGGHGKRIENPCPHCQGHGIVQKSCVEEITLEKGLLDGMSIVFGGKGNLPPHGNGVPGDLIISVHITPNDKFEVVENDLYFQIELNVIDAILGCSIDVNTVDNKQLTAKIPSGTSEGHKLRFRGYGIPIYGTNKSGDMIGIVKIKIPNKVTEEEKKLLLDLKEHENFK
jgi:molecular chaperone DnaJ